MSNLFLTLRRLPLTTRATLITRSFWTQTPKWDEAAANPEVKETPAHPPSSAPHGKILTGINFIAAKQDPVAKADSEYPDWLWTLLDPKPANTDILSREYQRKVNKDSIKAKNFLKKR